MTETIQTKGLNPILPFQNTQKFIKCLDSALMSVDIKKLKEVFERVELTTHSETNDFLSLGKYLFKKYTSIQQDIEIVKVEKRETRCIACSLGKAVLAYDITYKKIYSSFSVICLSSYAINLDINDKGELMEFAWCNAYLSKEEMNDFIRI